MFALSRVTDAVSSAASAAKSLVVQDKSLPPEVQKFHDEYESILRIARQSLSQPQFDLQGLQTRVVQLNQDMRQAETDLRTSGRGSAQKNSDATTIKVALARIGHRLQPLNEYLKRVETVHKVLSPNRMISERDARELELKMQMQPVQESPPELKMLDGEYETLFREARQLSSKGDFDTAFNTFLDKVRALESDITAIERLCEALPRDLMEKRTIIEGIVHMRRKLPDLKALARQALITQDQIGPVVEETAKLTSALNIAAGDYFKAPEAQAEAASFQASEPLADPEDDARAPASKGSLWSSVSGAGSFVAKYAGKAKRSAVKRSDSAC